MNSRPSDTSRFRRGSVRRAGAGAAAIVDSSASIVGRVVHREAAVERVVVQVKAAFATELIRAALGNDADHTAGRPTELGRVAGRLDLDFRNEISQEGVAETPVRRLVVSMPSMYYLFSAADAPSMEMPPLRLSMLAPAASVTSDVKSRPLGRRSMSSARMLVAAVAA